MKRILCVAAITPLLGGCWFVFIPGSMISAIGDSISGLEGRHCVGRAAEVGSQIKMADGRMGTVKKLEGESSRCTNEAWPIRAVVAFDAPKPVAASPQDPQ